MKSCFYIKIESEKSMKNLIKEHEVTEEEVNAIEIPNGITNGDMIKAMFPNIQWDNECNGVFYGYKTNDRMMPMLGANFNWWNATYKE